MDRKLGSLIANVHCDRVEEAKRYQYWFFLRSEELTRRRLSAGFAHVQT